MVLRGLPLLMMMLACRCWGAADGAIGLPVQACCYRPVGVGPLLLLMVLMCLSTEPVDGFFVLE